MSTHWMKIALVVVVMGIALFGDRLNTPDPRVSEPSFAAVEVGTVPLLVLRPPASYASNSDAGGGAMGSTSGDVVMSLSKVTTTDRVATASNVGTVSIDASVSLAHAAQAISDLAPDRGSLTAPSGVSGGFYQIAQNHVPETGARIAYVADVSGGAFSSQHVDARWPLASLSKLMTAVIVFKKGGLDATATVPTTLSELDDTRGILNAGDVYSVDDLLRVMLVYSSNVAAETLTAHYGRDAFLAAMNTQARDWGMVDTNYSDPSGLSSANESSVSDLSILARHVLLEYPQIFATTRIPQITVTEAMTHHTLHVKNINEFAGRADFIGGKTGYTNDALGNILSVFRYHGRPVIIIVLGTANNDRFRDTSTLLAWFEQNYK